VCGESALAIHELIDDIPTSVHIVIPRGTYRPSISYPPTTVTPYAAETFSLAIERFEAAPGEMIPMYGAARSVVDAMRHRRRFGETLALAALGRDLRREGHNGVRDLQEIARDLGALSTIRPIIEAVLA
jgi:predicted transcriptional regulator of viral defense system